MLLTSVGLLALLPYLLKRGWQTSAVPADVEAPSASAPAPSPLLEARTAPPAEALAVSKGDLEELTASLFSLRMAVSDANADLEEARVMLDEAADDAESATGEVA